MDSVRAANVSVNALTASRRLESPGVDKGDDMPTEALPGQHRFIDCEGQDLWRCELLPIAETVKKRPQCLSNPMAHSGFNTSETSEVARHLSELLDEALALTFPASDPVAISVQEAPLESTRKLPERVAVIEAADGSDHD